MIYLDLEQGSDPWFAARKGIPTASRFDMILTPTGKPSAQARKLICELIGEKYSLIPPERVEQYTNRAIRWGQDAEEEARRYFSMETGLELLNGGFCLTDDRRFGASPDNLVGDSGCLELKAPQATTHAEYLLDGVLPATYRPQVHGHLIVTGRKFCWFMSYCPGFRPLLLKVEQDEYTDQLRVGLEIFWEQFQAALKKINNP